MIRQTALPQNATQAARSQSPNVRVKGVKNWHAQDVSAVVELFGVIPKQGLTSSEVMARRLRYGPNSIESFRSSHITQIFALLFLSIVIGFLTAAAILNSAIADSVEAFSLLAVTVLGAIVGFAYLLRSARAFDEMEHATRTNVCVKREGQDNRSKAADLVPGDIIVLSAGDCVPADARLIEAASLWAEELALRGRRSAVEKVIAPVAVDAALGQRSSMLYLGTKVQSGSGVAVVVATGLQAELGRIALGDA